MRLVDVQQLLARRCDEAGSQRAFAAEHGLNAQYVSQVLSGLRPPSTAICTVLGIRSDGERWVRR